MGATAATLIAKPLFTSTAHRIDFIVTDDEAGKERATITGITFALLLTDLGGTTRTYAGTIDDATAGEGHFTLTGANHVTVGAATAQIHMDGIPKSEYTLEFRAKATV